MSTRARVGVQLATGEIKSVYVWWDGNPDTLGTTLNEYYATPEKAAALVERGNLIDVEQTLRRCTFERPEEGYEPMAGGKWYVLVTEISQRWDPAE